jgi:hypothetical protein
MRATYQLCQAIQEDLASTDVQLQAGQLTQLHDEVKAFLRSFRPGSKKQTNSAFMIGYGDSRRNIV